MSGDAGAASFSRIADVIDLSRFYAARGALLMRLRSQVGRGRRRVIIRALCRTSFCLFDVFDVSECWFQPEIPARRHVPPVWQASKNRGEPPLETPGHALAYLPGAGSNVSSRISAARVTRHHAIEEI